MHTSRRRWRVVLLVTSVAILVLVGYDFFILAQLLGDRPDIISNPLEHGHGVATFGYELEQGNAEAILGVNMSIDIANGCLLLAASLLGFLCARGRFPASACEAAGIMLVGATLALGAVKFLANDDLRVDQVVFLGLCVAAFIPYLLATHRLRTSRFWTGVKSDAGAAGPLSPAQPCRPAVRCFVPDGGVWRACAEDDALLRIRPLEQVASVLDRIDAVDLTHSCVELLDGEVAGTLALPRAMLDADSGDMDAQVATVLFSVTDACVELACDDAACVGFVERFCEMPAKAATPMDLFCDIVYQAVVATGALLVRQERRLDRLQDNMAEDANEIPRDFSEYILAMRKMLRSVRRFLHQCVRLGTDLARAGDACPGAGERDLHRFAARLEGRCEALSEDVQALTELLELLHDSYQSRIATRQNGIIRTLTVVTILCLPPTLVGTWYGMNEITMPERSVPYIYFVLLAATLLAIIVECVIFKVKKWF